MDWGLKSALTGSEKFPGISCWTAARILRLQRAAAEQLSDFIDELGVSSAKAQGYSVITSSAKFRSSKHRLFIYFEQDRAIGLLKVGEVSLFVYVCVLTFFLEILSTRMKSWFRTPAQCSSTSSLFVFLIFSSRLLFSVSVSAKVCSRQCSRFSHLLEAYSPFLLHEQTEQVTAAQLGYDRPSAKFLSFLSKHFRLNEYHPQPNGFVIFEAGLSRVGMVYFHRSRDAHLQASRSCSPIKIKPKTRGHASRFVRLGARPPRLL